MRKTTEDFIGTCQACFGEFKVNEKSSRVVLHGYRRPGYGSIVGNCVGHDHAAFEHDFELTVTIIGTHREAAALSLVWRDKLEAGEVTSLPYTTSKYDYDLRKSVDVHLTITPSDDPWDYVLKSAIGHAEASRYYHERVADYLKGMVDNWKRGVIVGIDVPATGKERALRKAYDPEAAELEEIRAAEKAARAAKDGKLRLVFYRPEIKVEPAHVVGYDEWNLQYGIKQATLREWREGLKTWAKEALTGKSIVREASDWDLPRDMRLDNQNCEVVVVNAPWAARDTIKHLFPGAVKFDTTAKKINYAIAVGGKVW